MRSGIKGVRSLFWRDPSGRRIAKDVDGTVTKYLYDGDQCIAECDVNDVLLRKYIYGPGVDQPICMIDVEDSNATYYYHYDALGSVVALSDADGDTVQVYEYDVYGQVAASGPNHPNPFLFTGRRYDTETGLYYYRARYYNPSIGRFLQTDPIGYGDGMNMYAYCRNNGVRFVDPWGLEHDPYDLPWNRGDPIAISVAFYDGGDPGYDADGDGEPDAGWSTGDQFKESADDFVYVHDGKTYYLYFDMNVEEPGEFIGKILSKIAQRGYNVTGLYFYDHCGTDDNGDFALEFGSELWGPAELEAFGKRLNSRYPNALAADTTIHFRHCDVASDQSFLEDLATWFNRNVTGVAGRIIDLSDPDAEEIEGPDYLFMGDLWMAKPGEKADIIWRKRIPVGWVWDPLPRYEPGLELNPEPHGY